MIRFRFLVVMILVVGCGAMVMAQGGTQKVPPPIEQRTLGAPPTLPAAGTDPGELTDEEREQLKSVTRQENPTWSEFLVEWMTPRPIPKATVVMIDDTYGYPHIAVSIKMEVVDPPPGHEDTPDVVWMRGIPPENPASPLNKMWQERQAREMFFKAQKEWEEEHGEAEFFLDFQAEILPAPFMDSMRFESLRSSLPDRGHWQMSFALDDMNGDGHPDLVLPPARKGAPRPVILLGLGDGQFKFWQENTWPKDIPLDYGGLATADFDGDGHKDVVLAIHFKGQYVMYGDGKGGFGRSRLLPSPDARVTSRAPAVADFNGDGRDDVAMLAEIDYDLATNARLKEKPTLWVVLNTEAGWAVQPGHIGSGMIGDNLVARDVNADGHVDLVVASNAANHRKLVYLNHGDAKWSNGEHRGVLSNAYHSDVAMGEGSEFFSPFVQFLVSGKETTARTGIVVYDANSEPGAKGSTVFFDEDRYNPYFRIACGDINGDGLTDLVAARKTSQLEVYLRTADGEYYKELSPELDAKRGTPFDIHVRDLDGDGRDDVVVMFADKEESNGGVYVWMSKTPA